MSLSVCLSVCLSVIGQNSYEAIQPSAGRDLPLFLGPTRWFLLHYYHCHQCPSSWHTADTGMLIDITDWEVSFYRLVSAQDPYKCPFVRCSLVGNPPVGVWSLTKCFCEQLLTFLSFGFNCMHCSILRLTTKYVGIFYTCIWGAMIGDSLLIYRA